MVIVIRQATIDDAAGIAHVQVDCWRTTYAGLMPDDYLANLSYEEREAMWRRVHGPQSTSFVYVAEDEAGRIVGFVSGGPQRLDDLEYDGELHAIYILQEHQGKGIGRRLAETLAQRLAQEGYKSMILWVLKENASARGFYEALGGKLVREGRFEIDGVSVTEVAYGWPDILSLLEERKGENAKDE
jgi:ribosomal protein S18 acetylase RimI-like enzyme